MSYYQNVIVSLANGKKYRLKCLNVKRIGSIVICELAIPNNLDFGLMFWNNKMFLYHVPENSVCGNGYSPLDLLFVNRLCIKEIKDIRNVISDHYFEEIK